MTVEKGEVYSCTNEECGCEVKVTKGCSDECEGKLICCCGKPMEKQS